jgi:hypothetical protein
VKWDSGWTIISHFVELALGYCLWIKLDVLLTSFVLGVAWRNILGHAGLIQKHKKYNVIGWI